MWLQIAWTVELLWGVTNWNWTHTNEKVWIEQFIGWVTWPWWGGCGEGVSEITQLFLPQLGGHSAALLASSGNFFAPTSFLLPPPSHRPNLGCCVSPGEESWMGANTSQFRWLLQLMVMPSLMARMISVSHFIYFSAKFEVSKIIQRPAWCGWQHTYKMLKKCGKTVQDFDPFLDLWEGV